MSQVFTNATTSTVENVSSDLSQHRMIKCCILATSPQTPECPYSLPYCPYSLPACLLFVLINGLTQSGATLDSPYWLLCATVPSFPTWLVPLCICTYQCPTFSLARFSFGLFNEWFFFLFFFFCPLWSSSVSCSRILLRFLFCWL